MARFIVDSAGKVERSKTSIAASPDMEPLLVMPPEKFAISLTSIPALVPEMVPLLMIPSLKLPIKLRLIPRSPEIEPLLLIPPLTLPIPDNPIAV